MINSHRAGDDIRICAAGHIGEGAAHMQVRHKEWRWRLRPEDQPGRARLVVSWRYAERCQGVQRLREVVERPRTGIENRNVRLHQGRTIGSWKRSRLYQLSGV